VSAAAPRAIALLGPQRTRRTLRAVLDRLAPTSRVATITAGWQEREPEDAELNEHLGGAPRNLELYRRAERLWRDDPELRVAHRELQARLRTLREAYNLRLANAMDSWMALEAMQGDRTVLEPEREAALAMVRDIDRWHLNRMAELRRDFEAALRPADRPTVRRERDEVVAALEGFEAVAIAGGHVAVLLNRMRLFDVHALLADRVVVAWAAGAMVLAERVVLFHDSPPQGPGHAEAFETGLGVANAVVPLPHAGARLRLDDPGRVSRFARRFEPAAAIALDPGEAIQRTNGAWTPLFGPAAINGARRLEADGSVRELEQ